jgi:serine/threonine-protein phosphatase PP1 catalytic subunit
MYCFINLGKRRYNLKIWKYFLDVFNVMPVAAVIEDKIFCTHGGLSPDLNNFDAISKL